MWAWVRETWESVPWFSKSSDLVCAHFTTASSILTLILAKHSTRFLHFQIYQVFLPSADIQGRWGSVFLQNVKVSSQRADSIGVLYVHGLLGLDIRTQKHWLRQTDIPPATERQARHSLLPSLEVFGMFSVALVLWSYS